MSEVKLVWITPDTEKLLAYQARVSNPANQGNHETAPKLLNSMLKRGHWSPFEMADACIEITVGRDIARQMLRHRSFFFQEFSQRYQRVDQLPPAEPREARLQDHKNRQNSIEVEDPELQAWWLKQQEDVAAHTNHVYFEALDRGIAKEVARSVLSEGLTTTRMYMKGTIRSWIHYCALRCDPATQKEHREIALAISAILRAELPNVWEAAGL